jgi:hypothetical protein
MNSNKQEIKSHIRNPESDAVLLGISQNELNENSTQITTKNCAMRAYAVIHRVYLHTNKSPTVPISKDLKVSPQNNKRREREKPRTQDSRNSSMCANLKLRSDQNLWAIRATLPRIELGEHNHNRSTKIFLDPWLKLEPSRDRKCEY